MPFPMLCNEERTRLLLDARAGRLGKISFADDSSAEFIGGRWEVSGVAPAFGNEAADFCLRVNAKHN
jgi:hypothetical protein